MDQTALRREFDADRGYCLYCQKSYVLLRAWYRHIVEDHAGTIRAASLEAAVNK